jgi:hypothetical protein
LTEEQDARIALMDHFRFYLQFWGTTLVALATACLSIILVRTRIPVGLLILLVILILFQAGHTAVMLMFHGRLCELAVTEPRKRPAWDQSNYVTWLHAILIDDMNHEWRGFGKWLCKARTWTGWTVVAVVFFDVGNIVSACYDSSWKQWPFYLFPIVAVVATVVVTILIVRDA